MKERVHVDDAVGRGGVGEHQGHQGGAGKEGLRGPGGQEVSSSNRWGDTLLLVVQ